LSRKKGHDKKKILVIAAGSLLIVAMVLGVVIPVLSGFGGKSKLYVGAEGVYIYEKKGWHRVDTGGKPWVPQDNKTYLIYFKNLECTHCRMFDPTWVEYVSGYSMIDNLTPVEIVCTWFTQQCNDPSARASFAGYENLGNGNFGTPWLVLIYNRTIVYYYVPPTTPQGGYDAKLLHETVMKAIQYYLHPELFNQTSSNSNTTG
jgi:hypothetical protein